MVHHAAGNPGLHSVSTVKRCRLCRNEKPETDFYAGRAVCKACHNDRTNASRRKRRKHRRRGSVKRGPGLYDTEVVFPDNFTVDDWKRLTPKLEEAANHIGEAVRLRDEVDRALKEIAKRR